MADIKIGNKTFNGVESVQFPSANDPTFMREFTLKTLIADMIYPTDYFVKLSMVENEDGTAVVYMDTDTTTLAGEEPLPISKTNNWFILFCEDDEHNISDKVINGYVIHSLGGKPYYSAALDFGYSFTSKRNAGFHMCWFGGSLYNTEWGAETGKYSLIKYSASQFTTIKNNNCAFDTKKCRLYGCRYPIAQLSEKLGDTDFVQGEVSVNE